MTSSASLGYPTLIGKADRITLCRSLCDQMLHQQTALLQQLHWLAPMMPQEVLVSWFAAFLVREFRLDPICQEA